MRFFAWNSGRLFYLLCVSLTSFAVSSGNAHAAEVYGPQQVVKRLFVAIERADEAAILSSIIPGGSVIEQEIPADRKACPIDECTDAMAAEVFAGGVVLMGPLKAIYKLGRPRTDNGISTITAEYIFFEPVGSDQEAHIFKCGEAIFTSVITAGRWIISGFTYTNNLDRSQCRLGKGPR